MTTISFLITTANASREAYYELEEQILDAPGADAFFEEDSNGLRVTARVEALPQVVSILYGWCSEHQRVSTTKVACASGAARSLLTDGPNEIVDFLANCEMEAG
ncbi:MAG: hypothetical protein GXP42_19530 [Chloroflexi bacterium]|nr:hypothetical protein [Chloroflexota bacterium]